METAKLRFVKLNRFHSRLSERYLAFYRWKLAPLHFYFSVLNWLFPERVGKKTKARYCVPLNGETFVDVDSHIVMWKHNHYISPQWHVCPECLELSKELTLQTCDEIQNYYSKLEVCLNR